MSASRFLFGLLLLAAANLPAAAQEAGRPDTSRLVTIGGSLTEIVYALGEESRLVARDTTSTYPEAALRLPDVGYMRALSPEGVLSVEPTAIIALEGSGPAETMDVLEKASVPVVTVPESFDREGILAKIEAVGAALGVEDKAAALATKIDKEILAAEAAARHAEPKRVLFVLSLEGGKVLAAGANTAADGIIAMAGGENVVTGYSGYKQLADEAVVNAQPEIILMMNPTRSGSVGPADILKQPAIAATPAGAAGAVIRMEGSWLLGFGPRTAEAIGKLSASLYGPTARN